MAKVADIFARRVLIFHRKILMLTQQVNLQIFHQNLISETNYKYDMIKGSSYFV